MPLECFALSHEAVLQNSHICLLTLTVVLKTIQASNWKEGQIKFIKCHSASDLEAGQLVAVRKL